MSDHAGPPAPVAARRPLIRTAHGVERVDDYAWLAAAEDPEVLAYLSAERAHYDSATAHLGSLRLGLAGDMIDRTPPAERSVSWRRGGLVYYTLRCEGEEYERIYRHDIDSEHDLLVLDPNQLAAGSPYLEVGLAEPSPDGRLLAYSVDRAGGEVYELRFRDLETGADRPEVVPRTYCTGAWSADSASFLYTVPDGAHRPDRVRRHVLGTDPADDTDVVVEPDQRFELAVSASRDGGWIQIEAANRDTTEVRLIRADAPGEAPRVVAARRPGIEYAVEPLPGGWDGRGDDELLLVTDDGDTEFRVMRTAIPEPGATGDPTSWTPVPIASEPGERLEFAAVLAGHVVLGGRRDVEPFLRVVARGVPPRSFEVHPGVPFGQVRLWKAEDYGATTITVVEENLISPPTYVEVALDSGARRRLRRTEVPGVDLNRYTVTRIEAPSTGGALVPVTVAHRRDVVPDGSAPGLLYGYGAYESCDWPAFDVGVLSLLDRGVVYATAHVRGGGERGRHWWLDGRLRAKQHTFDDFVAARDALVRTGWVDGERVASRGLSAGGLLQGAVFSQTPDRWRAVVAEVPFVDVVTTMSDPSIPLTVNEWGEWGNPVDDADDFAAMLAYSPYDHPPPPPPRPALLVTGAVNDPRVLVHEPAKWVARLRAGDPAGDPRSLVFRVELGQGAHAGPNGRLAHLGYEAEILAWVLDQLRA
jgi:oligopeptidase B